MNKLSYFRTGTKYATDGIGTIESVQVLKLDPISELGTPREIFGFFGEKKDYLEAVRGLEDEIYKAG